MTRRLSASSQATATLMGIIPAAGGGSSKNNGNVAVVQPSVSTPKAAFRRQRTIDLSTIGTPNPTKAAGAQMMGVQHSLPAGKLGGRRRNSEDLTQQAPGTPKATASRSFFSSFRRDSNSTIASTTSTSFPPGTLGRRGSDPLVQKAHSTGGRSSVSSGESARRAMLLKAVSNDSLDSEGNLLLSHNEVDAQLDSALGDVVTGHEVAPIFQSAAKRTTPGPDAAPKRYLDLVEESHKASEEITMLTAARVAEYEKALQRSVMDEEELLRLQKEEAVVEGGKHRERQREVAFELTEEAKYVQESLAEAEAKERAAALRRAAGSSWKSSASHDNDNDKDEVRSSTSAFRRGLSWLSNATNEDEPKSSPSGMMRKGLSWRSTGSNEDGSRSVLKRALSWTSNASQEAGMSALMSAKSSVTSRLSSVKASVMPRVRAKLAAVNAFKRAREIRESIDRQESEEEEEEEARLKTKSKDSWDSYGFDK